MFREQVIGAILQPSEAHKRLSRTHCQCLWEDACKAWR